MIYIKKIKLLNFKRFESFNAPFNNELNIIIGDNESGKSTILTAIDLVLSGSRTKVDTLGLDNLLNSNAIQNFFNSEKSYKNLPKLIVELYLNEQNNIELNGKINTDETTCDGLRLICEPNDDLSKVVLDILKQKENVFPFEFYSISFKTFSGENYSGYKKYLKNLLIDNSQSNSEYALREYIKDIYNSKITGNTEKFKHLNEYRKHKEIFKNTVLSDLNSRLENYNFSIRTNTKSNLETDLSIVENNINIENKGKGRQCFIKTEFALSKRSGDLDVILIEEPENHLSHVNMKKLIQRIHESKKIQMFIATHNNLISSRLDLRRSILLNSNSNQALLLDNLSEDTAKFFMKAPDNNILEYILSKKVILVEGDSEFILMDAFFTNVTDESLENSDIHVISVGGTSFKRYLDIAKILEIKTAVIRDNDKDYVENCVNNYSDYKLPHIKVFSDDDNDRYTFEVSLYQDNVDLCEDLFSEGRRSIFVVDYMLNNKSETAFILLEKKATSIKTPQYIIDAIKWIRE